MDRSLIDFLDGLDSAENWDIAWEKFEAFCQRYGVRYVTHLEITPDNVHAENARYRVNMDPEWIDRYMEHDYVAHDPAIRRSLSIQSPCLFSRKQSLNADLWSETQVQIANEAREFGLGDGAIIPYFGYKGDVRGSITMFTEEGHEDAASEMETNAERLMLNALMMHIWYADQNVSQHKQTCVTGRQQEILRWMAAGLQNDQIADKMNISYDGVSYHMREIKKRLGVRSHREIVPKAIRLGLISL